LIRKGKPNGFAPFWVEIALLIPLGSASRPPATVLSARGFLTGHVAQIFVQFLVEASCLSSLLAIHLPHGERFDINFPLACKLR
jgi:hypothetical protein